MRLLLADLTAPRLNFLEAAGVAVLAVGVHDLAGPSWPAVATAFAALAVVRAAARAARRWAA